MKQFEIRPIPGTDRYDVKIRTVVDEHTSYGHVEILTLDELRELDAAILKIMEQAGEDRDSGCPIHSPNQWVASCPDCQRDLLSPPAPWDVPPGAARWKNEPGA